jgi:hypothetical protein
MINGCTDDCCIETMRNEYNQRLAALDIHDDSVYSSEDFQNHLYEILNMMGHGDDYLKFLANFFNAIKLWSSDAAVRDLYDPEHGGEEELESAKFRIVFAMMEVAMEDELEKERTEYMEKVRGILDRIWAQSVNLRHWWRMGGNTSDVPYIIDFDAK